MWFYENPGQQKETKNEKCNSKDGLQLRERIRARIELKKQKKQQRTSSSTFKFDMHQQHSTGGEKCSYEQLIY